MKEIETTTKLEEAVKEILFQNTNEEELEGYITDLMNHGCVSGMVSGLIYYSETTEFFNEHKEDINILLSETLQEVGCCSPSELFRDFDEDDILCLEQSNQNLLAWFAFEETVRKFAYQLEMEI